MSGSAADIGAQRSAKVRVHPRSSSPVDIHGAANSRKQDAQGATTARTRRRAADRKRNSAHMRLVRANVDHRSMCTIA